MNLQNPVRGDDGYVKRPALSVTIHPDLKKTLVSMSERTGMSVSQVSDEVLYTGLIEMLEGIDGGTEESEESEGDTDTTAPILSKVTAVTTASTDSTPNYTFS